MIPVFYLFPTLLVSGRRHTSQQSTHSLIPLPTQPRSKVGFGMQGVRTPFPFSSLRTGQESTSHFISHEHRHRHGMAYLQALKGRNSSLAVGKVKIRVQVTNNGLAIFQRDETGAWVSNSAGRLVR
jgi:hypothetical protein